MIYRTAADIVVALHLTFIAFAIAGGFVVLRWPRLAWIHLPVILWAIGIEYMSWVCPLTPLENWLRLRGGEAGYATSFTEHYILPFLYPRHLTYGLQVFLGSFVLAVNTWIYWRLWRRRSAG